MIPIVFELRDELKNWLRDQPDKDYFLTPEEIPHLIKLLDELISWRSGENDEFNQYQQQAIQTDTFLKQAPIVCPEIPDYAMPAFMEKVLGLAGETGEYVEKFKKLVRDRHPRENLRMEDREELAKELGDILWYVSANAHYLNIPLKTVAEMNIAKLDDRQKRNKIHGEGDNR